MVEAEKCGHIFHPHELDDWFLQNNRFCPVCSVEIVSQTELDDYLLKT